MRQHRVIRRERTQDVAGEEHADQRQMDGEPRHQIADRDLGDPQPVGDVGQDAHDHEIAHAQHETGRDQRGDRQREEAFAPLLPTDGGTGHDRTPAVFLFFQTEHTLAAPPAAQGPETRRRRAEDARPIIHRRFRRSSPSGARAAPARRLQWEKTCITVRGRETREQAWDCSAGIMTTIMYRRSMWTIRRRTSASIPRPRRSTSRRISSPKAAESAPMPIVADRQASRPPRAPQTNQGRHGPERAMRPSICPTTAIHIAAATDTCSPRATANPAEPRSASADPGLPSSP